MDLTLIVAGLDGYEGVERLWVHFLNFGLNAQLCGWGGVDEEGLGDRH